jgi:probable O-glycosylation ligase (exosortase A-associated)
MSLVIPTLIYGRHRISILVGIAALSIGFYGVKGGIFTLTRGGMFNVLGPEGSFIGDNNSVGLAFVMTCPLLYWLSGQVPNQWWKRGCQAAVGLTMLSAVFTYSRGAMVGLAVVGSLLFLRTRGKLWIIFLLAPLIYFGKDLVPGQLYDRAYSIEDYETDSSAQLRLQSWGVAFNIAKERPFTGGGFAFEYMPDDRWLSYAPFLVQNAQNYGRAAHSIYFQVLGYHGFMGLALFVGMLASTLLVCYRLKRAARRSAEGLWVADLASAIQISMIGYMVSGAFLSLASFDLPYFLIAICAVLQRELIRSPTRHPHEVNQASLSLGETSFTAGEQRVANQGTWT